MAGLARPCGVRRRVQVIGAPARIRSLLRFRSFQSRLLVFFLGLFVLVQASVFLSVNAANVRNARQQIDEALDVTASVFERVFRERTHRLLGSARLLASDFAFKKAYATRDHGTILSALENFQGRIGADAVMLAALDRVLIADTQHPQRTGTSFPFPPKRASGARRRPSSSSRAAPTRWSSFLFWFRCRRLCSAWGS